MTENLISAAEFQNRIKWPLDRKIQETLDRIELWIQYWGEEAAVSLSGGLDSTVLLHIVRNHPRIDGWSVPAYFADTGTEYPDIRRFVKSIPGVTWVRPKMKFHQVIRKYGYPVVSKKVAQYVLQIRRAKTPNIVRLRLAGLRKNGTFSPMAKLPNKWHFLLAAPFQISDECCTKLKKSAMKGRGKFLIGVRATESKNREKTYLTNGCNAFNNSTPRSWPMAFWTDNDIKEYIRAKGLEYCPIYDLGYTRTGCFPCAFGVHLEPWPNRFQLMEKTHPRLWNLCMDRYGLQGVFEYMNEWLPKTQRISFRWKDYEDYKTSQPAVTETELSLFDQAS